MHALALLMAAPIAGRGSASSPTLSTAPPSMGWSEEVYTLRSDVLGEELRVYVGKPPGWGRIARGDALRRQAARLDRALPRRDARAPRRREPAGGLPLVRRAGRSRAP